MLERTRRTTSVTVFAEHERFMRIAITEAEKARGTTGDNPWVGCVLVDARAAVVARGFTQGPGEDHAEIVAMGAARAVGLPLRTLTLYSTLEPCAFHGRTPACALAIIDGGIRRVVIGVVDPNPRVDGLGVKMLRDAGVEVIDEVCAEEITLQLSDWLFLHHPHEPLRRARALLASMNGAQHDVVKRRTEIDRERARPPRARRTRFAYGSPCVRSAHDDGPEEYSLYFAGSMRGRKPLSGIYGRLVSELQRLYGLDADTAARLAARAGAQRDA